MTYGGREEVTTFEEMCSAALLRMKRREHICGYLISLTKGVRLFRLLDSKETYIACGIDAASKP